MLCLSLSISIYVKKSRVFIVEVLFIIKFTARISSISFQPAKRQNRPPWATSSSKRSPTTRYGALSATERPELRHRVRLWPSKSNQTARLRNYWRLSHQSSSIRVLRIRQPLSVTSLVKSSHIIQPCPTWTKISCPCSRWPLPMVSRQERRWLQHKRGKMQSKTSHRAILGWCAALQQLSEQ